MTTTHTHQPTTAPGTAPGERLDVEQVGRRVEDLLDRVADADPAVAGVVERLVAELVGMYGQAIQHLVDALADVDPATLRRLGDDRLLGGLMALHDLHPVALDDRIEAALDQCRPQLGSHGGGVVFLGVEEGVVHLRLEGNCDGCGASEVTLRNTVEAAVTAAAPEVVDIDVEGAVPPGQGHAPPPDGPPGPLGDGPRRSLPMFQPAAGA